MGPWTWVGVVTGEGGRTGEVVEGRADPTYVGGRVETSGATVGALGCVGSFPDSNRGLEAGSGVGDGGSEKPSSPPFPP